MLDFLRHDIDQTDAPTRRASAVILVALALVYPAWHWCLLALVENPNDPLWERSVVGALALVGAALGRRGPLRGRFLLVESVILFVLTGHYFSLVWRNDFATPYVAGISVLFASVSVVVTNLGLAIAYAVFSIACIGLFIAIAPGSRVVGLDAVLGMATVLLALCVGAHRASVMRRSLVRRLGDERRLLKQVLETIPDPVFVRNPDRDLVLANQAARRFDSATGYDLDPVASQELATLETGESVEADTQVRTQQGPISVSVKTARTEAMDQHRLVVTVMRDVTDRRALEDSLKSKIAELQQARERVRQLQGMLPICMHCSRIRGENNQWETLERFVTHHSEASFTHTLCNTCLEKHYPEEAVR